MEKLNLRILPKPKKGMFSKCSKIRHVQKNSVDMPYATSDLKVGMD